MTLVKERYLRRYIAFSAAGRRTSARFTKLRTSSTSINSILIKPTSAVLKASLVRGFEIISRGTIQTSIFIICNPIISAGGAWAVTCYTLLKLGVSIRGIACRTSWQASSKTWVLHQVTKPTIWPAGIAIAFISTRACSTGIITLIARDKNIISERINIIIQILIIISTDYKTVYFGWRFRIKQGFQFNFNFFFIVWVYRTKNICISYGSRLLIYFIVLSIFFISSYSTFNSGSIKRDLWWPVNLDSAILGYLISWFEFYSIHSWSSQLWSILIQRISE